MPRTFISIKAKFTALHCWPECPFEEVGYLRSLHRHEFHVQVIVETFEDRQKEFIMEKNKLQKFLNKNYQNKDLGSKSCEIMSAEIAKYMKAKRVCVEEDGENGAIYIED